MFFVCLNLIGQTQRPRRFLFIARSRIRERYSNDGTTKTLAPFQIFRQTKAQCRRDCTGGYVFRRHKRKTTGCKNKDAFKRRFAKKRKGKNNKNKYKRPRLRLRQRFKSPTLIIIWQYTLSYWSHILLACVCVCVHYLLTAAYESEIFM